MKSILILHNIRSIYNVGAIFRTADAAGVLKIYLVGYTPTPLDHLGRPRKDLAKTALGAEQTVAWEHVASTPRLIGRLKKEGYLVIALEQDQKAIAYRKIKPKKNFALIVGEEVQGIPKNILAKADMIAEIPMHGKKESLNVSVATGIALFQIANV